MSKLIGLSLSFCVKDILAGAVAIDDVAMIVTNTAAETDDDWRALLEHYGARYWRADPARGQAIAEALRASGRVEQPRLTDPDYQHSTAGGHWLARVGGCGGACGCGGHAPAGDKPETTHEAKDATKAEGHGCCGGGGCGCGDADGCGCGGTDRAASAKETERSDTCCGACG